MPTPLPVIAQTFRCALRWRHPNTGQTAVNVMHIRGTAGVRTPTSLFEAMDEGVTATMWNPVTNSASIEFVDITPLDGTSATQTFGTGGPNKWSGNTAGDFVPAAAGIVKLTTALRGRNHRGRVFLPFITEASQDAGAFVDGSPATLSAAWGTFATSIAGDDIGQWEVVVAAYDRRHGGLAAAAQKVIQFTGEAVLGTQRRRQGRLRGA